MNVIFRDLDRAMQAYDQRCVPTAMGRFLVIIGFFFVLAGILPPANMHCVWVGLCTILPGVLVVLPFRQSRSRWIAAVGGGFTMLLAGVYLAHALMIVLPLARIIPFVPMNQAATQARAVANAGYQALPWMVTRVLTAFLSVLLATELFASGWFLIRLDHADGRLPNLAKGVPPGATT